VLKSASCIKCATMECQDNGSATSSKGTPVGAAVGASIGGLAVAGLVGFVIFKICTKKRRERQSMAASTAEKQNDFGIFKSARASTHTVASIASTVRTRASNVIQIAYIPGVTNRSAPSTPAHLVPPVPPLPLMDASSPVGSQFPRSPTGDIQFGADDLLRGSVVDNRASVATTIYGQSAVVSQSNIVRAGKAAVVQVKAGSSVGGTSSASSPSTESVPAIPALFTGGARKIGVDGKPTLEAVPPSPAFSIGSTFFNRMNSTKTKTSDADTFETLTPKLRTIPGRSQAAHEQHSTSSFHYDSDDEDIRPGARSKKLQSQCSSCITDMDTGSPFSDANSITIDDLPIPAGGPGRPRSSGRPLSMGIGAGNRNSKQIKTNRTVSPFDDSNSIEKPGT